MTEPDEQAVALLKQLQQLEQQRKTWENHWQEIGDYIIPRKADVTLSRTAGDKRMEKIYDATAIHAAELLSASLHGMLTNPSSKWFDLQYRNDQLNVDDEAKEYLEGQVEVMYKAYQRSNFAEQIHELYHDLVTFGTGVMLIEDVEGDIRFSTRHISECFLSEDEWGRVDTVFRKFKMSLRAMAKKFGNDKLSEKRLGELSKDPYKEVEIVHVVMPRDANMIAYGKKDSMNKPFKSCYVDPDSKTLLRESGFDEFPYVCPRFFKASHEQNYGRSVSMVALPDVKMLNAMSETTIKAAQKQVDPPLMVPDDGFMLPVRTKPSGLNFYRAGTRDRIEPLQIGAQNPLGLNIEEQRRNHIRSCYYVDQLLMGQGPQKTATEVIQLTEEKMRILGPVLGRLTAELLNPMTNRVYNILGRNNQFAEPPMMLEGGDVDVEYVSPLAKAQRQSDIQSVMQMFELLSPLASINAGIFDHFDFDGLIRHILKTLAIPATVTKGEGQVAEDRENQAMQQQQAQEMAEVTQISEAMGSAAPMAKVLQSDG
tara:strand:- start:17447 stop:19063 length:1617 start_codon:yes stop_codon:yes gene_type:complete